MQKSCYYGQNPNCKNLFSSIDYVLCRLNWFGQKSDQRSQQYRTLRLHMEIQGQGKTVLYYCAVKKIVSDHYRDQKMFSSHSFQPIGGKFIFCCDFDGTKIPIILPKYYRECFECSEECSGARQWVGNLSVEDISKPVIWTNRFICSHDKSVYNRKEINKFITRIN